MRSCNLRAGLEFSILWNKVKFLLDCGTLAMNILVWFGFRATTVYCERDNSVSLAEGRSNSWNVADQQLIGTLCASLTDAHHWRIASVLTRFYLQSKDQWNSCRQCSCTQMFIYFSACRFGQMQKFHSAVLLKSDQVTTYSLFVGFHFLSGTRMPVCASTERGLNSREALLVCSLLPRGHVQNWDCFPFFPDL